MKLADALKLDTIPLNAGDYLVANTASVGYLPTHRDTTGLQVGHFMFRAVTNAEGGLDIIPLYLSEDGKTYVEDAANPIIKSSATTVTYVTTRNDPTMRDVYRAPAVHVQTDIATADVLRHILAAFVAFADSEYSLGVNHFQIEGADFLDTGV
jgi:hypothetical protein